MEKINVKPFIKWAGGKRQLLEKINQKKPVKFNKYIEPFLGGGAVFFDLQPENSKLNDINKYLINTYLAIKEKPEELIKIISLLDEKIEKSGKEYYLEKRSLFNQKITNDILDVEAAALFIFLNKHAFNGLYRVNSKGLFNVPYNNSVKKSIDPNNIMNVSKVLKQCEISNEDFEVVCNDAKKGDFIFIDSPYAPIKDNSFESYTKEGFSEFDHHRLADTFKYLDRKGCFCMLTNHNTGLINKLYRNYNKEVVSVKRMINSDKNNRTGTEIIITNY